MNDVLEDIQRRAQVTPRLAAVRFGDDVVTYGALDESISSYETVMDRHGLSRDAAFHAGLLHCMPSLTRIDGTTERNRVVGEVVAWLARDIEGGAEGGLRAVG
ncbi:hypothetical protein GTV32_21720 [Gordonia sp. SID5947]|uniref:hypothetical protein n=1 Tax=Gordonia sp. SID5947 TaxID=2690315 RepID=UPI00136BB8B9|nr:hypothetical protein [Gordonia sp. SID5947]MYR08767.1 hypothetical protein [Gordonia sp. SID5947]